MTAKKAMPWVTRGDAPTLYVNHAQLQVSIWDFHIRIGRIEVNHEDRAAVIDLGTLIMSPPHAKALARVLEEHLAEYEKRFGKLPKTPAEQEAE